MGATEVTAFTVKDPNTLQVSYYGNQGTQCGNNPATYSTVSVAVKYLRWQRVALCRLLLRGNVFVHPLPLFFRHGDVHLLELYLVGFQKSNHILLLLLDLERR